jgi:hypothetical protein
VIDDVRFVILAVVSSVIAAAGPAALPHFGIAGSPPGVRLPRGSDQPMPHARLLRLRRACVCRDPAHDLLIFCFFLSYLAVVGLPIVGAFAWA